MTRVEVDALRLLVAIRDAGSIAGAAHRLGVTQPAASSRLRAMENRLGLTLVSRRAAGSQLTEAGHALCGWAEPVFDALHRVELGVDALVGGTSSDMAVAASRTIAEHLLPAWISALRRRRAELTLHLSVTNSRGVLDAVRTGRAQIGFIETPGSPRGVESLVVGWDDLALVAPPAHPWAKRRAPVSRAELRGEALIVREVGSGTRETLERHVGGELTAIAMQTDSTRAIIGAALGGLAPAVVSSRAVAAEVHAGALIEVPVEGALRRPFRAVWRAGERPRPPATDLLACISG